MTREQSRSRYQGFGNRPTAGNTEGGDLLARESIRHSSARTLITTRPDYVTGPNIGSCTIGPSLLASQEHSRNGFVVLTKDLL